MDASGERFWARRDLWVVGGLFAALLVVVALKNLISIGDAIDLTVVNDTLDVRYAYYCKDDGCNDLASPHEVAVGASFPFYAMDNRKTHVFRLQDNVGAPVGCLFFQYEKAKYESPRANLYT